MVHLRRAITQNGRGLQATMSIHKTQLQKRNMYHMSSQPLVSRVYTKVELDGCARTPFSKEHGERGFQKTAIYLDIQGNIPRSWEVMENQCKCVTTTCYDSFTCTSTVRRGGGKVQPSETIKQLPHKAPITQQPYSCLVK